MKLKALFGQSKKLEKKIEEYLIRIMDSILIFQEGVNDYLDGNLKDIPKTAEQISSIKDEAAQKEGILKSFYIRKCSFLMHVEMCWSYWRAWEKYQREALRY